MASARGLCRGLCRGFRQENPSAVRVGGQRIKSARVSHAVSHGGTGFAEHGEVLRRASGFCRLRVAEGIGWPLYRNRLRALP